MFSDRLGLLAEEVLGGPLESIVDPQDAHFLSTTASKVLHTREKKNASGSEAGALVNVRVVCGGASYEASMSIKIRTDGLIVVTHL